jgi:hypothetical protein
MKRILAVAALASLSTLAHAEGVAVGLSAGTLGVGAQLAWALGDDWKMRLGANGMWWNGNGDSGDVDYDFKYTSFNAPLIVDWFPAKGVFRISGGIVGLQNKLDFEGRPQEGTYEIGNTTYAASEIGSVKGDAKWGPVAGYLGVGWGNAVKKGSTWSWNVDVGVMYMGKPKVNYTVTCGTGISAARCTQLQNDAAQEGEDFKNWMEKLQFYPVATFWMAYQF